MIFARKMPEFYIIIARKIFSPNFRGAHAPSPLSPPVSHAYGRCNRVVSMTMGVNTVEVEHWTRVILAPLFIHNNPSSSSASSSSSEMSVGWRLSVYMAVGPVMKSTGDLTAAAAVFSPASPSAAPTDNNSVNFITTPSPWQNTFVGNRSVYPYLPMATNAPWSFWVDEQKV